MVQILAAQSDRQSRKARDALATTGDAADAVEGVHHLEFERVVIDGKFFPGLDCRCHNCDAQEGVLRVCKRDTMGRRRE